MWHNTGMYITEMLTLLKLTPKRACTIAVGLILKFKLDVH